jgi:phage-related tail protein
MRVFGATTAMSISFSLIGSIFILPSFLGVYAKRKMAKDPKYFEKHVDIQAIRDHVAEHIYDFDKTIRNIGPMMIEANKQFANKISDFGKEMEKAGKGIGKAAGKAGKHIEKGARKAGEHIGKTGEHIGKAAGKAGEGIVEVSDHLGKKIDEVAEVVEKEIKRKK